MNKILDQWLDDAKTVLVVPSSDLTIEDNRRVIALIAALKIGYHLTRKLDQAWSTGYITDEIREWVLRAKSEMEQIMEAAQVRNFDDKK